MGVDDVSRSGIQLEVPVASEDYARGSRRRFDVTMRFVAPLRVPVLDLGPPNALARLFERRDQVQIEHTGTYDLDRTSLQAVHAGPFATVTAFEILEHLMNPLFVLDGCRQVLQPDGVLFLSVPRRHPHEWLFGKSPEHFHEFTTEELRWLIERAGFDVERFELANTSTLGIGVRPLLRRMFKNLILVRCRPRPARGG